MPNNNALIQTKASKIIEGWKEVFNEQTVTAQSFPNAEDYDQIKAELLTNGKLLPAPNAPYVSTIEYGSHQYTVFDADHDTAPAGMQDNVTSSSDGIEHIKTKLGIVGGDNGKGNLNSVNK